jgi:hypothetical protein
MVFGLLVIVGVYALCAVVIHMAHAYSDSAKARKVPVYYLAVVTRNNQTRIEWYLGAYLFISWLRGRQTVITVFDEGSTDETCTIVNRIGRERPNVRLVKGTEELVHYVETYETERLLVLYLYRMDASPKRPLQEW